MAGYYRSPALFGDDIIFVCEDDLWIVPVGGGIPRRLTSNLGAVWRPRVSPDGSQIAFGAEEEGPDEIYVMQTLGGEAKRLTYQAAYPIPVAWSLEGDIVYSSNAHSPHDGVYELWTVSPDGGLPTKLPYGPADHIAYGPDGQLVLGRHTGRDPSRWKRYRGGTAGQLWIDADGGGVFERLNPADGNYADPMWIDGRVYFIADHEGVGNIYSCLPNGEDLRRHTDHDEYYARGASHHGGRIVYHAGADLFLLDLNDGESRKIEIDYRSPFIQRQRKFVDAEENLQDYALHPRGLQLSAVARGQLFSMANWEGGVLQHGEGSGVRYRFAEWLNDGQRIAAISDAGGEYAVEIHSRRGNTLERLEGLDIGQPYGLEASPKNDQILLTNNRFELLLIDLEAKTLKRLDQSEYRYINGAAWSPDGKWIAYGFASSMQTCSIKLANVETGETRMITPREFRDYAPAWDPDGKFLYFISDREFNPVYDDLHFELSFPKAGRPFLVTLKADELNPFLPQPRPLKEDGSEDENENAADAKDTDDTQKEETNAGEEGEPEEKQEEKNGGKDSDESAVQIDFEGIERRIVGFPYPEGVYTQIDGIEGKALFVSHPARREGASFDSPGSNSGGTLHSYTFKEQEKEELVSKIEEYVLSRNRTTLAYRDVYGDIRIIEAGEEPSDGIEMNRSDGWIDLERIKASVVPMEEWRQMYREAWRLQREYFWTEDLSGVDWTRVYERYLPLLERIGTRGEFSDLVWEMQGELGTSHAYVQGGDYREHPNYGQGFLGADFERVEGGFAVRRVVEGDSWIEDADSPLNRPGVNIRPGDVIAAVAGRPASQFASPGEALANFAGEETELTVRGGDGEERIVVVKPASSEAGARYREWVVNNRRYVHEKLEGQAGYVHIPDMGANGFAEFHRAYLAELDFPALIVDVRHNGGGIVSELLLEKLARKRIGYIQPRYQAPIPYPDSSVLGPMVALTDENAGSDGDRFSHAFKLMGLGPLVGMRTWGGVVGMSINSLVDGGTTVQPGWSNWFEDAKWGIENYGAEPDIEVPYAPHDYVNGADPQLDRAIVELRRLLEENPPRLPDLRRRRPRLPLPTLPPREES